MEGDAGTGQLIPARTDGSADDAERKVAEQSPQPDPVDDAGAAAADDDVDSTPAEATPAVRSRLDTRGWLIAVCATLLVLAVVAAAAGVLTLRANRDSRSVAQSETAAMQAAKDCVTATQAPDTTSMLASQQKIIDCATGDFGAQAALYSGVLVDAYQAAKAQVQVSDMRAAVERHNGDGSMDVLVALRVKVSNSAVQDQETGYRLRVQMAPDNGTYKIARLDQVTK